MSIVEINNISFGYKHDSSIINNFSLFINKKDKILVKGDSGSGKSTLIHLIAGYLRPAKGTICVFDKNINHLSDNAIAEMRRHIGVISQFNHLLKDMTVIENVMMPLLIAGASDAYHIASEMMEKVGIGRYAKKSILDLSGGEQKRVAVARALVNNPRIILADEATANLDQANAYNILNLCLQMISSTDTALLWTTHDLSCEKMFDRIVKF